MSQSTANVSGLAIHLIAKRAQIDRVKATETPIKFIELLGKTYNQKKPDKVLGNIRKTRR